MAQSEGYKVCLEAFVHSHRAIFGHSKKFLVFRPSQSLDRALIPLQFVSSPNLKLSSKSYVYAPNQFPGATVNVDARFRGLRACIRMNFLLIAMECYLMQLSYLQASHTA